MYVIEVTLLSGQISYLYETSSLGKKYLDFPAQLFSAKQYKLKSGAETALLKFNKTNSREFKNICIREVSAQDIELAQIEYEEENLKSELERLNREYSSDSKVLKPMERKLASMLVSLKQGDLVRYYSYIDNEWQYELVPIEEVRGFIFIVKGNQYKRINGNAEVKGTFEIVMPDDDKIAQYFLALSTIKAVEWHNVSIDKIIKIIATLKEGD